MLSVSLNKTFPSFFLVSSPLKTHLEYVYQQWYQWKYFYVKTSSVAPWWGLISEWLNTRLVLTPLGYFAPSNLSNEWMNEYLKTPQHEKQIGYWVSEKGKCMKWFCQMKTNTNTLSLKWPLPWTLFPRLRSLVEVWHLHSLQSSHLDAVWQPSHPHELFCNTITYLHFPVIQLHIYTFL